MFPSKSAVMVLFLGLFIFTACSESPTSPIQLTLFPPLTPTASRALPTPSSPGDPVTWRNLQVRMEGCEMMESYTNEFGSLRIPPAGSKFLWTHIRLENLEAEETLLPEAENFSVLYAESEFKPVYGHRQGYVEYTDLGPTLFPRQEQDAWLRFDVPQAANLEELWFVYLPTSTQVGVSPSSPDYPYAQNKQTYLWKCELQAQKARSGQSGKD